MLHRDCIGIIFPYSLLRTSKSLDSSEGLIASTLVHVGLFHKSRPRACTLRGADCRCVRVSDWTQDKWYFFLNPRPNLNSSYDFP